jgi:hypothetical protein
VRGLRTPRHPGLLLLLLVPALAWRDARAEDAAGWSIEPALYVYLPGLTGTVGIGAFDVDLDSPSDAIWNINFAFMGSVRVGYGPWALTTDVMYGDLGVTNGGFSGSVQQLIFEPTLSRRLVPWVEPLAGVRYMRMSGDISRPFGNLHAVTQGWVDPILGVNFRVPLGDSVDLHFRGDVGGFGIGSKLTWQLFPYVAWRISELVSVQGGYRVLSVDYEKGTGSDRVLFDVIELGPQIGVTFHFGL